jgi:uncharacterized membrane protein
MAKEESLFIFVGTYPDELAARNDYEVIKDLHAARALGSYDAAVITKDVGGKVHVNKDEMATRHGAWGGIAVGALVGILFPPSIIASAAVGGAVGGVGGHLWRGLSRSDVKDLGELLDEGETALIVIGESKLSEALDTAGLAPAKHVKKEVDVDPKDLSAEVAAAAKELGSD